MSQLRISALARVFGGGAAHVASRHWCAQRFTAIALVPLTIWFLASLLALPDMAYATVHAWAVRPLTAALLCLLVVVLFWHSRLGVHEVVEDYVRPPFLHRTSLLLSTALHLLAAAAALLAVLRMALADA